MASITGWGMSAAPALFRWFLCAHPGVSARQAASWSMATVMRGGRDGKPGGGQTPNGSFQRTERALERSVRGLTPLHTSCPNLVATKLAIHHIDAMEIMKAIHAS